MKTYCSKALELSENLRIILNFRRIIPIILIDNSGVIDIFKNNEKSIK